MGKLKRNVCIAESDCFLFRATRGECFSKNDGIAPARVGRRKFPQAWRVGQDKRNSKRGTRANRITDSSGSRSGAGATIEGKQKAFVPPPAGRAGRVPREVLRGKYRIPLAGFASRGRMVFPPPRNASPAFWRLRRPPAALRAAPRAGASPVLQTSPRGTAPPRYNVSFVPGSRGGILCILVVQSPRAVLAETPVPDPRGRRRVISGSTIRARYSK